MMSIYDDTLCDTDSVFRDRAGSDMCVFDEACAGYSGVAGADRICRGGHGCGIHMEPADSGY